MKTFRILTIAIALCICALLWLRVRRQPLPIAMEPIKVRPVTNTVANVPATPVRPRMSPLRAKIIGITNFAELTDEQLRHYREVVAPGVSNFVALLNQVGASRFDSVSLSASNFLSLHDPKPGNTWD